MAASLLWALACSGACSLPAEDGPGETVLVDAGTTGARVAVVGLTGGVGHKIRSRPNRHAKVLAYAPDHAVLRVTGDADRVWWPVRYQGVDGWAHKKLLTIHDEDMEEQLLGFNFLLPWEEGTRWQVTQGHGGFSHDGISKWAWDFGMPKGTTVVASHSGVVRRLRGNSNQGGCDRSYILKANYVTIDRGDGLESHYVHLDEVWVERGEQVERGQPIGASGQTGYACGAHLHFQVQRSPSGGGTTAGANQSVHTYFWDTGTRRDPGAGARVISRNGSARVP